MWPLWRYRPENALVSEHRIWHVHLAILYSGFRSIVSGIVWNKMDLALAIISSLKAWKGIHAPSPKINSKLRSLSLPAHSFPFSYLSDFEFRQSHFLRYLPMEGWMTCNSSSFLTVFQSYQDDVRVIMKGYAQWSLVSCWKISASSGARTRDR